MATAIKFARIEQLRRDAKRLKREHSITQSEALKQVAQSKGFPSWELLLRAADNSASGGPGTGALPTHSVTPVRAARPRHYLHGDEVEGDPSQYYCARCDLFVEADHFKGGAWHGNDEDGGRFLKSLKSWELAAKRSAYRRPENPPNILAASAVQGQKMPEASYAPFYRWLMTQRNRNDILGDLAGDAARDKSFPTGATTKEELENHLGRHGRHIVEALEEAWDEFEQRAPIQFRR